MKVGMLHVPADADHDPAVVARQAEELGFDSYWLGDHPVVPVEGADLYPGGDASKPDGPLVYLFESDPLISLARASATTSSILLGTCVLQPAQRNAILTGSQVATLDNLCGGRFRFGIGGGWNEAECRVMGGDWPHRWTQIKDHIAAMREMWTNDPSEYHGQYVEMPPVRAFPKPHRPSGPPVFLGSMNNDRTFKRVVEWSDGWIPIVEDIAELAAGVERLKELAGEVGRDYAELEITVMGMEGQWRTPEEHSQLGEAGADRVIVWPQAPDLDGLLAEMRDLAAVLI